MCPYARPKLKAPNPPTENPDKSEPRECLSKSALAQVAPARSPVKFVFRSVLPSGISLSVLMLLMLLLRDCRP